MGQETTWKTLMNGLRASLARIPEHRRGDNTQYTLVDAGLAAFSVFFMQSRSFLAHQRDMQGRQGRNNATSLFGMERIPGDGQTRNLLDPVEPGYLAEAFWTGYEYLASAGQLQPYRHIQNTLLVSLDGSRYFSSRKVHCEHCKVQMRDEKAYYSHDVLVAVISAPEQKEVICLEPEFMLPQDGHEKQDCEQAAIKRWVERNSGRFAPWSVTLLTDDLHAHQPLCELALAHHCHFILTCKESSHATLYEEVALLEQIQAIPSWSLRRWTGRHVEVVTYRYGTHLPLRQGEDALYVNWCELTITREETGQPLYHNAWITDFDLSEETVPRVAAAGRSRWQIENEGLNTLKNQGYHFEHNFGHGDQFLSLVLLSLLLLAFLFHTIQSLCSSLYRAVRQSLGARRTFFADLRALTRYFHFTSWWQLLTFMHQELEAG